MDELLVKSTRRALQNSMVLKSLLIEKGIITEQEFDQEFAQLEKDGMDEAMKIISKLFGS